MGRGGGGSLPGAPEPCGFPTQQDEGVLRLGATSLVDSREKQGGIHTHVDTHVCDLCVCAWV